MATWVRQGTGTAPSNTDSDLVGEYLLDNSTAPPDFDPTDTTITIRCEWTITGSGFTDDSWDDDSCALVTSGGTEISQHPSAGTTGNQNTSQSNDHTDSAGIPTGLSVAEWESARVRGDGVDIPNEWVNWVKQMGPDGSTLAVSALTVTITYTPSSPIVTPAAVAATVTVPTPSDAGAPAPALPFSDDFTGTNSDPWDSSKWAVDYHAVNNATGFDPDIQTNQGRMRRSTADSASTGSRAVANHAVATDYEITGRVTLGSLTTINIVARGDGAWDTDITSGNAPHNGYILTIRDGTPAAQLRSSVNGVQTGVLDSMALGAGLDYRFRFQVEGTSVRAKVWDEGGSEPGTWDMEITSSDHADGVTQLAMFSLDTGAREAHVDDISATSLAAGTTVTPAVVAATSTPPAPTVLAAATVTPAVVAATATVPAPSVGAPATATPTAIAATATLPAPSISAPATATPTVVAATTASPNPTVTGAATVAPAVVAATTAAVTPSIAGGTAATPATIAAVATSPTPTVLAAGTVTPAVVAATTTAPTATVVTASTVTPAVVTAAAAADTPSIAGAATVTPAVVATTAALPGPTVTGAATVAPAATAAVTALPVVTVLAASTVTPAVVAGVTTVPTPIAGVGAARAPATVAATTTVPTPSIDNGVYPALPFSDDFTGTDTDPWDVTKWAVDYHAVNGATGFDPDIQTNQGRMRRSTASSASAGGRAVAKHAVTADYEVTGRVILGAVTSLSVILRGDGAWDDDVVAGSNPFNGYTLSIRSTDNEARLSSTVGGTQTGTLDSVVLSGGNDYRYRFQVIGTRIRAKVWDDGGAEPDTWGLDITSSDHADGVTQLAMFSFDSGARELSVDDISAIAIVATTPAVVAAVASSPSPAVSAGATVTPAAVAATVSVAAPVIAQPVTVAPAVVASACDVLVVSVLIGDTDIAPSRGRTTDRGLVAATTDRGRRGSTSDRGRRGSTSDRGQLGYTRHGGS